MNGARVMALSMAAALVSAGVGSAGAATIPSQHIRKHLRVDGSSDLRGKVHARGGLQVTAGLTTDTLNATGPAQFGGTLQVTGALSAGSVNAGSGAITTSGALQGGSLSVGGDGTFAGAVTVSKRLSATGADVGSGGLHVAAGLDAATAAVNGNLSAGSISTAGAISAGSVTSNNTVNAPSITGDTGTFTHLNVNQHGSINFNNASVTGLSGLNMTGNAQLASLDINYGPAPAANVPPPLVITQAGKTASLSVDPSSALVVSASALNVPTIVNTANETITQTLSVGTIQNSTAINLNAPQVSTQGNLNVGAAGSLHLGQSGNTASHIVGNHDTRGTCTASASTGAINSCGITFATGYSGTPVVVVTPTGGAPGLVTGYSVQASASGFTVYFTVSQSASVTFNYMVQA